jgi:hypothetical protein
MNIVKGNYKTSEFELKFRKPNKSFEEWQDVLMDKQYKYSSLYKSKREVLNFLLCVIGNEYDYENGYIIYDDISKYGNWEESIFSEKIQKVIDKILEYPELKIAYDISYQYVKKIHDAESAEKEKIKNEHDDMIKRMSNIDLTNDIDGKMKKIIESYIGKKEEKYQPYYPISEYSNISKFDENVHISYINAAIEICEDILLNKDKEEANNIEFAENFLKKFKKV